MSKQIAKIIFTSTLVLAAVNTAEAQPAPVDCRVNQSLSQIICDVRTDRAFIGGVAVNRKNCRTASDLNPERRQRIQASFMDGIDRARKSAEESAAGINPDSPIA